MTGPPEEIDPRLLEGLRALGQTGRDPARRAAGRDSLLRATSARRLQPRGRTRLWVLGVAAAVAATLVLMVVVSAGVRPDSPLYGVRRAAESVRLGLAFTGDGRGRLDLGYATERATESGVMALASRADLASRAAADAEADIAAATVAFGSDATASERELLTGTTGEVVSRLQAAAATLDRNGLGAAAATIRGHADTVSHQAAPPASPTPTPAGQPSPSPTACPSPSESASASTSPSATGATSSASGTASSASAAGQPSSASASASNSPSPSAAGCAGR